ncbi:MAG: hypothetical protein FJ244_05835 [Nitrospira sp.]|nr:hypothetical protein [Nitrospira sp.]
MRMTIAAVIFFSLVVLTTSAWAHTDEYFEAVRAPHGGQLRMTGPFHLELVAQDGQLMVYVTDHADNKISVEGGLTKATIETGPTKTQVYLHPVGDNVFKGSGAFALTPNTVVIVFMKLPNQDGYAARFIPLKPKSDPTEKAREDASKSGGDEHHHHHHSPKH